MNKVALIGIGRWGKIIQNELAKLAEIKYACDSKADLNQVWNDPEIESVFIATPTETHFEIAQKALEAGKNVFLEKPGTDSSEKLGKLVKLAETKQLKLAIGYEFPHHPAAKKLKELIVGKNIQSTHFNWQKWGTFKDEAVKHLLCHDIAILRYLGLEDIHPNLHHREKAISDTDITWTEFKSGKARFIESNINRVSPVKQKTATILLNEGGYIWSNNELFEIMGTELRKVEIADTTPVAAEIEDFLGSDKPLCNGHFALEVYKIIEQVSALR